jgi:hypothetical protein
MIQRFHRCRVLPSVHVKMPPLHACYTYTEDATVTLIKSVTQKKILADVLCHPKIEFRRSVVKHDAVMRNIRVTIAEFHSLRHCKC